MTENSAGNCEIEIKNVTTSPQNLLKELKIEVKNEPRTPPQNSPISPQNFQLLEPKTEPTFLPEIFFCKKCDVKLISQKELDVHNMLHSSSRCCLVCNEVVKNRYQFVGHIRKHMAPKPFLCPTESCDKTFSHPREIKLHQKVHSEERPFECNVCWKGFRTRVRLVEHKVVHTGEKRFKCKICIGVFATRASYGRHVKNMHEAVRTYECNYCQEMFLSRQDMEEHKLTHRNIDGLKCQICQEEFFEKESFNNHKLKHVQNKDSGTCEFCTSKTFYFSLKSHVEKAHTPRPCPICCLTFYDEKTFQNHQKSHLESEFVDNRDLACTLCGKQFDVLRYLKAHMQRHQNDYKKYICNTCEKAFSSKRDLIDHINVHTDTKNHLCEICNKAFRTKQSVTKHKAIHSDLRPFECEICQNTFKKRSILSKHLLTHSALRPFKCDCSKDFKSRYALNCHMRTHISKRRE